MKSGLTSINISRFIQVSEIPRNENGKIPRAKLAQLIIEKGLADD